MILKIKVPLLLTISWNLLYDFFFLLFYHFIELWILELNEKKIRKNLNISSKFEKKKKKKNDAFPWTDTESYPPESTGESSRNWNIPWSPCPTKIQPITETTIVGAWLNFDRQIQVGTLRSYSTDKNRLENMLQCHFYQQNFFKLFLKFKQRRKVGISRVLSMTF